MAKNIQGTQHRGEDNRKFYKVVKDLNRESSLSVKQGDVIELLREGTEAWFLGKNSATGNEGWVCWEDVKLHITESWYRGNISKAEGIKLLSGKKVKKGTFIVRDSETQKDGYTIVQKISGKDEELDIVNIRVIPVVKENGSVYYYRETQLHFPTLQSLIKHYSEKLSRGGSTCLLNGTIPASSAETTPIPRAGTTPPTTTEATPAASTETSSTTGKKTRKKKKDKWEIDPNTIVTDDHIGSGSFGEVHKGIWEGSTVVAFKKLKQESTKSSPEEFLKEMDTLKMLDDHPNLVKLYGVCSKKLPYLIVMEYVDLGSLVSYLRNEGRNQPLEDLLDYAVQVANGMAYLEEKNIVHRDLACRNILISSKSDIKICDFGLSRCIKDEIYASTTGKCATRWAAPESLLRAEFSTKSDVWSFGIVLTELVTHGAKPYKAIQHDDDIQGHLMNGYRIPQSELRDCPDDWYRLMLECWRMEPDDRPTFENLHGKLSEISTDFDSTFF